MTNQNKNEEMKELSKIGDIGMSEKAIKESFEWIMEIVVAAVEEVAKTIMQIVETMATVFMTNS